MNRRNTLLELSANTILFAIALVVPARVQSGPQIEVSAGRNLPETHLRVDPSATLTLTPTGWIAVAVRSPDRTGFRYGGQVQLHERAKLRHRYRGSRFWFDNPGPLVLRLGLQGSWELNDGAGATRFDVGLMISFYKGDDFACSDDEGNSCSLAAQEDGSYIRPGAFIGLSRMGVPGISWLGAMCGDLISHAWVGTQHELMIGAVVRLLSPPS